MSVAQMARGVVEPDIGPGLQELRRRAWANLKDTGSNPRAASAAVIAVEDLSLLDEAELLFAVQLAVSELVNYAKRNETRAAVAPNRERSAAKVETAVRKMEAQLGHALAVLSLTREGVDGLQRELGDLRVEDHEYRASLERNQAKAAAARRRWHSDVVAELRRQSVATIRALPLDEQYALARKYQA